MRNETTGATAGEGEIVIRVRVGKEMDFQKRAAHRGLEDRSRTGTATTERGTGRRETVIRRIGKQG